eukprot:PITA_25859
MLSGVGLGQELYAEAVEVACHLINRSPSSVLEDKNPQEVWTGKKPSLSHLRKFGCNAYVHVRKEKRTKLDSKSEREFKHVIKHEFLPKEPEKTKFELKEGESKSIVEEESEDKEPQTPALRISYRERRQLERYSLASFGSKITLSSTDDDPRIVRGVVDLEDGKLWEEAMDDEMESSHKNEAWDLVEFPAGGKPISSKWVFKKKMNAEGKVEKYKSQLVVKVYS